MRLPIVAVVFVCATIALTGCGGTGSSSSTSMPTASAPPATSGGGTSSSQPGSGGSSAGSGSGGSSSGSGTGSGGTGGSGSTSSVVALAFVGAGPSQLSGTDQFSGVSVDSSGKVSTTPGSPYSAGLSGAGSMTDLAGRNNLLFVTGHASSDTSAINITSFRSDANGSLTQLTKTVANGSMWLALDASGKNLYASAMADPTHQGFTSPTIYGFTIDQSSGALSPISGSPWSINYGQSGTIGEMNTIGVSPEGSNVCVSIVVARNSENVDCYPRHSDGTIDPNSFHAVTHNTLPQSFTFTPDGTHLLAVNPDGNTVQSSPLPGSTVSNETSSGGTLPDGIALHPRGQWLAVTNKGSGNVVIIEVGTNGSFAPTGVVMPAGTGTFAVSFSSSGNYLFVTANEGTFVFSFNSNTGALTPLNTASPAPGTGNVASL